MAEKNEHLAMNINGYSVGLIAEFCYENRIPFVHISSDYVFGNNSTKLLSPNDEKNPSGIYGKSKLLGEELIKKINTDDLNKCLILRVSWVFHPGGNNFVHSIINKAKQGKELQVVNDQYGGPTSAESISGAIYKLIPFIIEDINPLVEHDTFPWGIYHFQGQPIVSWYGFAENIIKKAWDKKLILQLNPIFEIKSSELVSPFKRPLNSRLNCILTEKILGLKMPNWEKDLDLFINSLNKN